VKKLSLIDKKKKKITVATRKTGKRGKIINPARNSRKNMSAKTPSKYCRYTYKTLVKITAKARQKVTLPLPS
jgi:hypothetical protein